MARKSRKHADTAAPVATTPIFCVGAYVRMSVEDKKQKGNSIENQQAIVNAYISGHTDLELAEVYIDNGMSGQYFDRPAFSKMIADMESGKINACITKDLSRLGRNAIDTGYYIEKFFPTKGIRYIAVTDNYDSADPKSGGVMISLKNMVNEAYALEVSRKVKATIHMNIRNGCFIGGIAPYGYFKKENDCHKLVIDPFAAGIVHTIFEMAANGQSHGTILEWLNGNGIAPPMRYFYSKGLTTENSVGAKTQWWSLRGVRDTLRNRMYCGDMIQGKKRMEGGVQITLPPSEWTITENTHEPVVSRELFAEVQKFWDKPKAEKEPYYKGENTEDILRARVFCGDCGSQMFRKRTGDSAYSYLCTMRVQYTAQACGGMRTTERLLKTAVLEQILGKGLTAIPHTHFVVGEAIPDSEGYKAELAKTKTDAEKNRRHLIGLYESLKLGDISETEYRELKSTYEENVAAFAERENTLRAQIQARIRKEKELEQARNSTKSIKSIADLNMEAITQMIEKIIVHDKTNIQVVMKKLGEELSSGREGVDNE